MPTILGRLVPTSNTFAAVAANDVQGGLHTVATAADRDAIPSSRRAAGMLVYVSAEGKLYQLDNALTGWVPFLPGSGTGRFINLKDYGVTAESGAWDPYSDPTTGYADRGAANSTALQQAIDQAPEGSVLYLPAGNYLLSSQVVLNKTLWLTGERGLSRLINATPGNYQMTLLYVGSSNNAQSSAGAPRLRKAVFAGDTVLPVTDISPFKPGQWVRVNDARDLMAWNGQDTVHEDFVRVESAASGQIIVHRALARNYLPTRNAKVDVFNAPPPGPILSDLELVRGRFYISQCADVVMRDCRVWRSDLPAFHVIRSTGVRFLGCVAESPTVKGLAVNAVGFFFHNATLCQMHGCRTRNNEAVVVRRGTRYLQISHCLFEGGYGVNTYTGDCQYNTISDCVLLGCGLVWGAGGHYADQFNTARNLIIQRPPDRAIGNAGTALGQLSVNFDGRALSTSSEHGFENGQALILYGTTLPTGATAYRRYYAVAPTVNSGTWANEFLLSHRPGRPPATVTLNAAALTVNPGAGWNEGDALTLHAYGSAPAGLAWNRIYFLRVQSGTNYHLQIRPGQTATFDGTTDRVTLVGAAGNEWNDGDAIAFFGGTLPTGLSAAPTVYYLRDKSGSNSFKLASSPGGTAIDFTGNGSGTIYAVVGFTGSTSETVIGQGGTPISLSGTVSAVSVTTLGEGNQYSDIFIQDAPANVMHSHRISGCVFDNLTVLGQQDATNGISCFTFNFCTDLTIRHVHARNDAVSTMNRIGHFSTCFDCQIEDSRFDLPNTAGQLVTGGTSENIRLRRLSLPALGSRSNLLGSGIRPYITHVSLTDSAAAAHLDGPASAATVSDANVDPAIPGTTTNVLVYAANLTATRVVYLDDNNAAPGDWVRVVRTGGGLFALEIRRKSDNALIESFSAAPQRGFIELAWVNGAWTVIAKAVA